mmetsp:Transcript_23935/g.52329  ORF Transcript_23935/g.52329 Transcript_23935/m.52329 type:complete len:217 (+) Transcript_23935:956-1606(+)
MRSTSSPASCAARRVALICAALKPTGTASTAFPTSRPTWRSAASLSCRMMSAPTSSGAKLIRWPSACSCRCRSSASVSECLGASSNGSPRPSCLAVASSYGLPMKRLASYSSVPGCLAAVPRASAPTTTLSPSDVTKSTDGVIEEPALFGITLISPSSKTATQLNVVPRSIPTAVAGGLGSICWIDAAKRMVKRPMKMKISFEVSIIQLRQPFAEA